MIHRRGVLSVLVLLVLVVVGFALQALSASNTPITGARATATATATPTAGERQVLRSLDAVERAYAAGDVRRLCRPGALLDPAVIGDGCERELESLSANVPRLRVTIQALMLRRELATAIVRTTSGGTTTIDFVRHGRRWLMSFSEGEDPLPALAGTT
jgi:hypothetical protein